MEVEGQAGGGLVKVTMNGRHEVRRVNIDDSLMQDDKEMIEDLLAAAVNDAVRKIEQETSTRMSGQKLAYAWAKPIIPSPIDLAIPSGVSEESSISTRSPI